MSRQKISEVKVKAIIRMAELGFTVSKISKLLGISRLTVYDHLHPDKYLDRLNRVKDYSRKSYLMIGSSKDNVVAIRGLNKRSYTNKCEVCGKISKRMYYHHWDTSYPDVGIWACYKCHRLAELVDSEGAQAVSRAVVGYSLLKSSVSRQQGLAIIPAIVGSSKI